MQIPWDQSEGMADLRSAARKRYSEFFHGTSSVGRHHSRGRSVHNRKPSRSGLRCHPPNGGVDLRQLHTSISGSRSPTSIRSVIDPSSSPPSFRTPLPPAALDQPQGNSPARAFTLGRPVTQKDVKLSKHRQFLNYLRSQNRYHRRKLNNGCFPTFNSQAAQKKFINCMIFGSILILILVIYIAISVSHSTASQEFHVILILFILLFSVFLCHSLIRFFMVYHNPHLVDREAQVPELSSTGGFAQPVQPIRVILARDEEMGFGEGETGKEMSPPPPPPVYGLWRGSVRVDPNLLHWQKVEQAQQAARDRESIHRPPSYISEADELARPVSSHVRHEGWL